MSAALVVGGLVVGGRDRGDDRLGRRRSGGEHILGCLVVGVVQCLDRFEARQRPPFDGGVGQDRVGLGLLVGDFGLELEAQDLAADLEVGRSDRLRLHRRGRFLDVLPAEPRQDAVPLRAGLAAGPQQRLVVDGGHAGE